MFFFFIMDAHFLILTSMNEHLKLISISDLNKNKDLYMSIHLVQHIYLINNQNISSSDIWQQWYRACIHGCLYSLTGQGF